MDTKAADESLPCGGPAVLGSLASDEGDGDQASAEAVIVYQRRGRAVEDVRVSAGSSAREAMAWAVDWDYPGTAVLIDTELTSRPTGYG